MNKSITKYLSLFGFLIAINSCDEKPITIPEFEPPVTDRVVLMEELTGVQCQGCPAGSAKLQSLIQKFNGNVIGVGIHGGFLCAPIEDKSTYDFRNDYALELEACYSPFLGKPFAVINRTKYEDQDFLGVDDIDLWEGYIDQELQKPNILSLFKSYEYFPDTRQVVIEVNCIANQNINQELRISGMVLESHIIDAQKNGDVIEDDYEHNHVLRDMLTDVKGDFLTNGLNVDQEVGKSYTYTLPAEDGTWKAENIEIVFAISMIGDQGEEIVQASELHLVE